jgi:hypothetical protein
MSMPSRRLFALAWMLAMFPWFAPQARPASPEYRAVRESLDTYADGRTAPDAVVPQPCDAASIAP